MQRRDGVGGSRGFTIIELIVYIVLAMLVMGIVYSVLVSQMREHALHKETMDARETLRGASALLASELRLASASGGDLYSIGAQSVVFRSVRGSGMICDTVAALPRYEVWEPSGLFGATADDSALVYSQSNASWNSVRVTQQSTTGLSACAWGAGFTPGLWVGLGVVVPSDTAGVGIGSGIRPFQRTEYGLFQQNSRWWLGRKLGSAVSFELVTGPLRSPTDSGLAFHYYDSTNAETAIAANVKRIEVVLRSESFGMARSSTGLGTRRDSLRITVFLRN